MLIRSFTTPLASPTQNLYHLFVYRNIAIGGQALTVFVAIGLLGMHLEPGPFVAIISLLVLLNLFTGARLRMQWAVTEAEFFIQLMMDVLALTAMLYFSGGSRNPFLLLYLLPIAIAASALPPVFAWLMAIITIACTALLMFFYHPLPHSTVMGSDLDLHVFGILVGFVISALLISYFVVKMGNTLRRRDRALADTREKAIRDENLVSLGTLAAGAAHELGSPLTTMAVVAKELEREYQQDDELVEKLRIMRDQIDRCKNTLTTIVATAGQARAESGRRQAVEDYIEGIIQQWRKIRPDANLNYQLEGPGTSLYIVTEQTLTHAIINILNNAADASIDSVEVDGHWDDKQLVLSICDRGSGLAPAVTDAVGKEFYTTKNTGMGLGLFLVHATVGRLGGEVQLFNREGGGACTRIIIPLDKLLTR